MFDVFESNSIINKRREGRVSLLKNHTFGLGRIDPKVIELTVLKEGVEGKLKVLRVRGENDQVISVQDVVDKSLGRNGNPFVKKDIRKIMKKETKQQRAQGVALRDSVVSEEGRGKRIVRTDKTLETGQDVEQDFTESRRNTKKLKFIKEDSSVN